MTASKITVSFDMRSPEWAAPTPDLYRAAIEMAAFVDRIGADQIGLMQHTARTTATCRSRSRWRVAWRR